jgi:hypothetical protein
MFSATMDAAKSAQICPKVLKFAQKQLAWRTLKYHQNLRFYSFLKKKKSLCRGGTKVYAHRLDFQYIEFPYAFFIVKKLPLYVNFSIPSCGKWFFSQCSTLPMGMRFCGHVPNSIRNKNMKFFNPYLLQKMAFLASKTLLSSSGIGEKNFLINFERYELTNGKEWVHKILWRCRHRS